MVARFCFQVPALQHTGSTGRKKGAAPVAPVKPKWIHHHFFRSLRQKKEKFPVMGMHPGEENTYFVAIVVVTAVVALTVVLVTGAVVATVVVLLLPLTTGCCATPVVTLTESVTLPFGAVVEPVERTLPSL